MVTPVHDETAVAHGAAPGTRLLLAMVVLVFFLFGGITNLNDVLIPKLKGLFALNYTEAMLVQFAFFTSYAIFSIPAGLILARLGYARGIVCGFAIMALACLLFPLAARAGLLPPFLVALFTLGAGITLLQVAVNPLVVALGPAHSAPSRLVFAQFFNSFGVFLMVRFGAELILGNTARSPAIIGTVYTCIAIVLILIAALFWARRRHLDGHTVAATETGGSLALLRKPRLARGIVAIFAYVGAEVSIASIMVGYLGEPRTLALAPAAAGVLLSYYWLGALAGRFCGGFLLRLVPAPRLLGLFALGALTLLLISANAHGALAAWSLILVGCTNSIMFPTIFSLSVEGLDADAPKASGLLCTAIVGGALMPMLTGIVADHASLAVALAVPAASYLWIAYFSWNAAGVDLPGAGTEAGKQFFFEKKNQKTFASFAPRRA